MADMITNLFNVNLFCFECDEIHEIIVKSEVTEKKYEIYGYCEETKSDMYRVADLTYLWQMRI